MNHRKLGRTSLSVSELCLGTMQFGWRTDEATSFALLDAYREAGGNFVQAATATSDPAAASSPSETHLGRWLRTRAIPRQEWVIATRLALTGPLPGGATGLATALRQGCEDALRRLGISYLDFLICDWNEHLVPLDDTLTALDHLVRAGYVRYTGAAGFPLWRVMESFERSSRRNLGRFEALQTDYSLLERRAVEPDALDLSREYRLGLLARAPLAGGLLAGLQVHTPGADTARQRWLAARYGDARSQTITQQLGQLARERGVSPAQMALAWVLAHTSVTAAVVGVTRLDHLRDLLEATRYGLSLADYQTLTALSA